MLELWGRRNLARLARESGVARESVSKILSYKRGIGVEVAPKLAAPLNLEPTDLLPPVAEAVSLASLDRRLQGLEGQVERAVTLMEEALRLLREARKRTAPADPRRRKAS